MVIRSREETAAEGDASALRAAATSLRLPSPSGSGLGPGFAGGSQAALSPESGARLPPLAGGSGFLSGLGSGSGASPGGFRFRSQDSPSPTSQGPHSQRDEDAGLGLRPARSSPSQPRMGSLPPLPGPPRPGSRPASAGAGGAVGSATPYLGAGPGAALPLPPLVGGMAKAASVSSPVPPPMISEDFFSTPAPAQVPYVMCHGVPLISNPAKLHLPNNYTPFCDGDRPKPVRAPAPLDPLPTLPPAPPDNLSLTSAPIRAFVCVACQQQLTCSDIVAADRRAELPRQAPPGRPVQPSPAHGTPPHAAAGSAEAHLAGGVALMEAAEWGLAGGRFGDALRAGAGGPVAGRAVQYLAAVKMLQARA